jgi:hypothetical protein
VISRPYINTPKKKIRNVDGVDFQEPAVPGSSKESIGVVEVRNQNTRKASASSLLRESLVAY